MRESTSDRFIFSADKSTISRSHEAVGQDGHRGLSAACLFCSPLLSAGVQRPGLPDLCSLPLTKVSASSGEKFALKTKLFFRGRIWICQHVQCQECWLAAPSAAHSKQQARCWHHTYHGHKRLQQHFVGMLRTVRLAPFPFKDHWMFCKKNKQFPQGVIWSAASAVTALWNGFGKSE